ncbi:TolC family protein [Roseomonas marmotae]|uniref:Protein CyaE n=1 Tax=Roseomonas marmotae TaxID=2768161 RepID=A0ABS3KGL9_9PROT|nr:TolC family protein [Roseomonas marmotae]MBO1076619.1 TolC family protein [Roseomonas marmotae]QTI79638.1 TolC family protein [Roseomonas marmotae]
MRCRGAFLCLALALAACAEDAVKLTSPGPETPWRPAGHESQAWNGGGGKKDFGIPPDPALAVLPARPDIDLRRSYRLPELIDIAQRNNPATRGAWQRAREAALAVGMVEATFLPVITANVIAGRQTTSTPLPLPIGSRRSFDTTVDGISPSIGLQWLLFDFGRRAALADAARHGTLAANVLFNGEHQRLIFDVTRAYYVHAASTTRSRIARETLRNSTAIRNASEARLESGLGTTVEVAQARQQVAQSELRRVQADGQERNSHQALLLAMGVNPTLPLKVDTGGQRRLPDAPELPIDDMVSAALARRPDVMASYQAMQASKAGIAAARAEFFPNVFVAGALAARRNNFEAGGLPTIGQQATGSGVLLGATVPLYDSGLRAARLRQAEASASAAESTFQRTQNVAVSEIVTARNMLRTALESHRAASALTAAATVTYDAALGAYRSGVGTVTAATAADTGLLDARQAQADTYAAAVVGAANLAFAVGAMTSPDAVP